MDLEADSEEIDEIRNNESISSEEKVKTLNVKIKKYREKLKNSIDSLNKLASDRNGDIIIQQNLKQRLNVLHRRATRTMWNQGVIKLGCVLGMIAVGIVTVLVAIGTLGIAFLEVLGLSVPLIATFKYLTDHMDLENTEIRTDISTIQQRIEDAEDELTRTTAKIDLEEYKEKTCKRLISYCELNITSIQLIESVDMIKKDCNDMLNNVKSKKPSDVVKYKGIKMKQSEFVEGVGAIANGMNEFKSKYDNLSNEDDKKKLLLDAAENLIDKNEVLSERNDKTLQQRLKEIHTRLKGT